jgi:hypothetical protein
VKGGELSKIDSGKEKKEKHKLSKAEILFGGPEMQGFHLKELKKVKKNNACDVAN